MKVIGTAGHIDHGKSTLVHRLTGIDPDRLEEEKRRGMTIDLGFAWLTLPRSGDVSIVDVPGHERFMKNMLAGAAGIDVALLVVAADEAVMPQTREHLDILDLLGVRHGVVALTKSDLVDEELLELAAADVEDALAGTTLKGSPIVPVSALTGDGIPALLAALDDAVLAAPAPPDMGLPFVPVDRVFSVPGFGTVVTGTLHGGTIMVGEDLQLIPAGHEVRVRGLQTHRTKVERALPGARVAVNLVGVDRGDVTRGDVLTRPGAVRAVRRSDVFLRLLPDAPFPIRHNTTLTVHLGAAEREATVSLLDDEELAPGDSGWAQLRFTSPVAAVRGQRFIVRLPAPARTVGGGEIVDVAPRQRRQGRESRLAALHSDSLDDALRGALPLDRPRDLPYLSALLGVGERETAQAAQRLVARGEALRLGVAYLAPAGWDRLEKWVRENVRAFHSANPLRQGISAEELRRKTGWSQPLWHAAQERLVETGVVVERDGLLALPEHQGGTAGREADVERVLAALRREPLAPPSGRELLASTGADAALLAAMTEEGRVVRVADGLYFDPAAFAGMVEWVLGTIRTQGRVTVGEMRDALGTSRKYALPVLEYLDARRITRREGDTRVLGSKADRCESA